MPLSTETPDFHARLAWIERRLKSHGYFLRADLCERMECDMSTASFAISRYREQFPDKIMHILAIFDGESFTKAGRKHGGHWYFVRPDLSPVNN